MNHYQNRRLRLKRKTKYTHQTSGTAILARRNRIEKQLMEELNNLINNWSNDICTKTLL